MKPVGLQLYTLRKPFAEDPIGTLERIKASGYDEVEFAAPLDMDFNPLAARKTHFEPKAKAVIFLFMVGAIGIGAAVVWIERSSLPLESGQ